MDFSPITFLNPRTVSILYVTNTSTSYFKQVSSDYRFELQTSTTLPPLGIIKLLIPNEFAAIIPASPSKQVPDTITGSWTLNSLSYTVTYDAGAPYAPTYTALVITPNFQWPAKTTLYISYKSLINPNIANTIPFQAFTVYDGTKLDQTDPADTSLKMFYNNKPPDITSTFAFGP
jgi:hypothetical protein